MRRREGADDVRVESAPGGQRFLAVVDAIGRAERAAELLLSAVMQAAS
ncbi:MAG: hypothetical protein ACRD0K_10740 [Egibacteraceae bacterium]